ncbi:MAG: LamG domain-containing protein [Firmicutes bacterium]|nr:LamG domain-containing protein [Bacillota bacterium]
MKKTISLLLAAAMLLSLAAAAGISASAADTTSDLIGYYKFEGDLSNSASDGDKADFIGITFSSSFDDDPMLEVGYDGYSFFTLSDFGDGLKLDCLPTDNSYTISFWAKALTCGFAAPIIWIGSETYNDASYSNWIGIWADFDGSSWSTTPSIGSNDESNSKVGAVPTEGLSDEANFDWAYITMTIENGYGVLYYNGVEVANTVDNFTRSLIPSYAGGDATELPLMFGDEGYDDTAIYVCVNAWDSPATMYIDELKVYDRTLSADDVAALYAEYDGHTISEYDPDFVDAAETSEVTTDNAETEDTSAVSADTSSENTSAVTTADSGDDSDSGDENSSTSSFLIWAIFGGVWVVLIVIIVVVIVRRRKS